MTSEHSLSRPYHARFDAPFRRPDEKRDREFEERIGGTALGALWTLADAVSADIGPEGAVEWWGSDLELDARRFVSDHIVECVRAVGVNLGDAQLHPWEAEHYLALDGAGHVQALEAMRQEGRFKLPDRIRPRDEVPARLARLHITACLHSVQAAFDCLGSAIIGIVGLPLPIVKGDLKRAIENTAKVKPDGIGGWLKSGFARACNDAFADGGPMGWLCWAEKSRHTFAHRPQLPLASSNLREVKVVDGRPVATDRMVTRLPKEPDYTILLAFKAGHFEPLAEAAETTLGGVVQSANAAVARVATALLVIWETRRAHPHTIEQPAKQWDGWTPQVTGFIGYSPNPQLEQMTEAHMPPALVDRLARAGVGSPIPRDE